MKTGTTFKRFKRRFKKKLYHFLLTLNEMDFGKLRPLCYIVLIAAMLLALAKLPTTETTNAGSTQVIQSASLATSIRNCTSDFENAPADVVALFLPEILPETDPFASLKEETLYSFYLTGQELTYLAEGSAAYTSKDKKLYLDGLSYTFHKKRLPFNRVTELSSAFGNELIPGALYHVISTEDIFSLFHYVSYRSIGIMNIYPKDMTGALLSDYHEVIFTETGAPLTIGNVLAQPNTVPVLTENNYSVVTVQSGFNLIDLVKEPNKITLCVGALFIALLALLWYMVPRMNRIRLWFRIYRIRSKKRSSHTLYGIKKRF